MTRKEEQRHRCTHAHILACAIGLLSAGGSFAAAAEEAADEPWNPLSAGRPILELRPRYNRIDESDKTERTEGYTYRAIVGWKSAPWNDLRFTAELIHTDHIGAKDFNDNGGSSGSSEYPLLPDPRYTGVNQAHVEYTGIEGFRLRAGRQQVRMDNLRWISDNDFRQIPQLFDGVEARNTSIPNTEFLASYFWHQRDTSGNTNDLRLTLLHAAWNPAPGHGLAVYGYFHDQAQNGAFTGFSDNSYKVYGARAEGAFPLEGGFEIPYTVEAAQQKNYAGGDSRIDANYWRLGGGLTWRDLTARYDEELKGSNDGKYGLQMPLTDFYSFNGWTLHFFNTPAQGLHDRWLTLRAAYTPFNLVFHAEAHRFRSDFNDLDFGKETDMGVFWSFMDGATLRLQHARYDPGSGQVAPRIRKTWITLSYSY